VVCALSSVALALRRGRAGAGVLVSSGGRELGVVVGSGAERSVWRAERDALRVWRVGSSVLGGAELLDIAVVGVGVE